jgi:ribose transport system substrate-binding protein
MARQRWRGVWVLFLAGPLAGCGGSSDDGAGASAAPRASPAAKPVVFVGFDASQPLVDALRQGKIQGLVVQNPLRMAMLSVEQLVKHL